MKRSLIVASCLFLASGLLTSCQKEEKNIVELTQELTAELQKISDTATADAYAERVKVLNKRYQDASVRVFALKDTALARGADDGDHEGASYSAALKDLARELGRVRASFPAASSDSKVDPDRLLIAVGAATGEKDPAKCKQIGLRFLHDETGAHETPGNFPEYYGSQKLRDALAYKASASEVSFTKWDGDEDVPKLPEPGEVKQPAASGDSAAADEDDEKPAKPAAGSSKDDDDDDDDAGDDDSSSSDSSDDDSSSSAADDLGIEF